MRVESGVEIARPSGEVFAYLSDFENNPKWQGGMVEARFTTDPPVRVGSWCDQVATFLGNRIESSFEVAEPLLRREVQKSIDADYANLKRILEEE